MAGKKKTSRHSQKKYGDQWAKTAKNKIKRIRKHRGDISIIEKYEQNPKWRKS